MRALVALNRMLLVVLTTILFVIIHRMQGLCSATSR
jgi:hypothetical protein